MVCACILLAFLSLTQWPERLAASHEGHLGQEVQGGEWSRVLQESFLNMAALPSFPLAQHSKLLTVSPCCNFLLTALSRVLLVGVCLCQGDYHETP